MSLAKPIRHLNVAAPDAVNIVLSPELGFMLRAYSCRLVNESGSTCIAAIWKTFSQQEENFYTFDGTNATLVSAASLAAGVNAYTTVDGTGFLLSAPEAFQAIFLDMSTVEASATLTIKYWNGSSYVDVLQEIDVPASGLPTNPSWLFFSPGLDWVPGGNIPGQNPKQYAILVTVTGAANDAVTNGVVGAQSIQYVPALPNDSAMEAAWDVNYPMQFNGSESLVAYFSIPSSNNKVIAFYSQEN